MTREKAIIIFQSPESNYRKALEMAIKALNQIPDLKEAYNKGYKDGQEALLFHIELCKEEGTCGCYKLKSKKEIKHAENNKS